MAPAPPILQADAAPWHALSVGRRKRRKAGDDPPAQPERPSRKPRLCPTCNTILDEEVMSAFGEGFLFLTCEHCGHVDALDEWEAW